MHSTAAGRKQSQWLCAALGIREEKKEMMYYKMSLKTLVANRVISRPYPEAFHQVVLVTL